MRTEARGRIVDEWKLRAGRPDNHWLDCLVGCAVAASTLGTALTGMATVQERKRKRYTQKDLRRR